MKMNSTSRIILAVVLSISLITTGCSAQWISVALADLPVLTQMALNIGALVVNVAIGETVDSGRDLGHPESFVRGQQRPDASAIAIQHVQNQSERRHSAEDRKPDSGYEPEPAGSVAGSSHQRSGAFRSYHSCGQSDSYQREQFCLAHPKGSGCNAEDRVAAKRHHPESCGLEEAVEPAGVCSQWQCSA